MHAQHCVYISCEKRTSSSWVYLAVVFSMLEVQPPGFLVIELSIVQRIACIGGATWGLPTGDCEPLGKLFTMGSVRQGVIAETRVKQSEQCQNPPNPAFPCLMTWELSFCHDCEGFWTGHGGQLLGKLRSVACKQDLCVSRCKQWTASTHHSF